MNDGQGGTTFTEIDAAQINGKPSYTTHTIDTSNFSALDLGNTFMFKVEVSNVSGTKTSPSVGYVLADVPATPTNAPVTDPSVTSTELIKIDIDEITNDGGSPILSYSLEIDDGNGGDFKIYYGELSNSLSRTYTLNDVNRGHIYRTRYRTRNIVGYSDYSPIGYIQAAKVP